jgi:hypothetical protein
VFIVRHHARAVPQRAEACAVEPPLAVVAECRLGGCRPQIVRSRASASLT